MILISGGHNAEAVGATDKGFSEYPETRVWAETLSECIWKMYKANSYIVPSGSLREKVAFINSMLRSNWDSRSHAVAVEVHFNSSPRGGKGSETLFCPGSAKGEILAQSVQSKLTSVFQPSRGVTEGWYRMDRPGVIDYKGDVDGDETPDYFLKMTHCPAIIVEPEFVQNQDAIQDKMLDGCEAIAKGIMEYLA